VSDRHSRLALLDGRTTPLSIDEHHHVKVVREWFTDATPRVVGGRLPETDLPSRAANGQQTSEIAWLDNAGSTHVEAKEPHEQCRRMAIVVHIVTAEVACHAGGRGFESRRSRL
jgi:hypothetical protein